MQPFWRAVSAFGTVVIVIAGLAAIRPNGTWAADKPKPIDFNRDILPILSDHCFTCHGPDANKRDADLRLDTREGIFADRGGYRTVVPGNSVASELYLRLISPDDFDVMPPSDSNPDHKLTATQIGLIKRWIDEGASYEKHWAYVAPERPPPPEVKDKSWPRNPIDNFVLARLEAQGLRPSPEADRATLLRRVSFDLTGLPPTPAEVKAFLEDKSPNAYEKQVDRLLASPQYGENMARMWLDLARYADSQGYQADGLRTMWPWRDWVIKAYNHDMPYDQFTIEQLAGDLLPNATLEDKIATGFSRNHPGPITTDKDAARPVGLLGEERSDIVADSVSTMGTTWLGLTVGCARCHDHKFDPIKQKDFYRLGAYFNNVAEFQNVNQQGNNEPFTFVPSPPQREQMDALKTQIQTALARAPEKEMVKQENQWRETAATTIPPAPADGLLAYYPFEGTLADSSGHGRDAHLVRGQIAYRDGIVGKGAEFSKTTQVETTQVDFGSFTGFDRTTPFSLSLWTTAHMRRMSNLLQQHDASPNWSGWEIALELADDEGEGSRIAIRMAGRWPEDALEVRSKEPVLSGALPDIEHLGTVGQHLTVSYDGSGKASGVKLYVDGKPVETEILKDQLTGSFKTTASLSVGDAKLGSAFTGVIDEFRLYNRRLSDDEVENLYADAARSLVKALRDKPVAEIPTLRDRPPGPDGLSADDKPSKEVVAAFWGSRQQAWLAEYFLSHAAPQSVREAYANLKHLQGQRAQLEEIVPTTMVMAEMDEPMDTFVLGRGQYNNKREKVTPGVPGFLLPLPEDAPANRLTLARWLVDPRNPLTSRVAVNRYWQNFFGIGIVKTAEDFGSQGEPPSHPQLLDWLATEFIRTGWDVKGMQRLMVLSATYRQASKVTPQLKELDPENRLLARGPRVRLAAEEVRDNALAMSGLLTEKVGGPSVYPYQPEGLWSEGNAGIEYKTSAGSDLYRRSLYTIWRRSMLAPSMAALDAPDREICTARRLPTNTPLQALVLLDDPTYVEASRSLAARAMGEAGQSSNKRLDFLFSWAIERKPDAMERNVLLQEEQRVLGYFQHNPEAAQKLLHVGASPPDAKFDPAQLAAWTMVSRTVLNMDETITKQ